jgi:hypothetical protein
MHGGKGRIDRQRKIFVAICKFPQLHAGKKAWKARETVRRIIPREDKTQ